MKTRFKKNIVVTAFFFSIIISNTCFAVTFATGGLRMQKKVESLRDIRNKHVVKQSLDYSCGPAGIATILNYYLDDPVSETEIINGLLKRTNLKKVIERKGFSLLDLKKFIEERGYKAVGYGEMDVNFLRELNKPILVPIKFKNFRHFVVVKGVIGNRVFVADPTMGNMSMKCNFFVSIWEKGIGLIVEGSQSKDPFRRSDLLRVKKEDGTFVDYKSIERMLERAAIRTAVYPTEF
ncbi:MAG: C39 family peptidase [Candidatus Omnitrophica bacterium]|nr:C39 family peptidase [Candidatus Omnitrophota bacterium]